MTPVPEQIGAGGLVLTVRDAAGTPDVQGPDELESLAYVLGLWVSDELPDLRTALETNGLAISGTAYAGPVNDTIDLEDARATWRAHTGAELDADAVVVGTGWAPDFVLPRRVLLTMLDQLEGKAPLPEEAPAG